MIPLRNQMAAACGYDTFPEYAYAETYGRDYTVADAQALHRLVKDYIVPVETCLLYTSYRSATHVTVLPPPAYQRCSPHRALPHLE